MYSEIKRKVEEERSKLEHKLAKIEEIKSQPATYSVYED
jgi:hypothetical protein